jgi:hypothetical protein
MVVPEELPSNEDGVGLLPSTVMVKSDGSASPPPSLTTRLVTNNVPTCDALLGVPLDGVTRGGREDWDEDDDDDWFVSVTSLVVFLCSFPPDGGEGNSDDASSLSLDVAYDCTKLGKTKIVKVTKRRKLDTGIEATFDNIMVDSTTLEP